MMRSDYISWDELFMGIAELASKRSKDPDTRCGACIVNPDHHVMSIGYNGLPRGLRDNGISINEIFDPEIIQDLDQLSVYYDYWKKPNKYEFSVHAEENAILNSIGSLKGCSIYVYSDKGYYPCSKCARDIIQKGIIEVVMPFAIENNTETYKWHFTKHMFRQSGVKIRLLKN